MRKENKFNQLSSTPTLLQTLKNVSNRTGEDIYCMRIGFIEEFHPEDLTAIVRLAQKKTIGQNQDGTQQVRDYALISAKVCYSSPYMTYPLKQGDECLVLFADTELESWFITGEALPEGYPRMHDITDAVVIAGIRSMPKMIEILADCLNLFYGTSNIALSENLINITADTTQVANLQAMNGASGNIVDSQGKTLAKVEYGIITEIY